ncbi:hypothetical protein [Spirillospora sp. NPDC047279]|uniref:hypothetical protein n=1 Tax=Spirillospora sp. NPDC047279 TaxID=3155478 RepID=UPI0034077538
MRGGPPPVQHPGRSQRERPGDVTVTITAPPTLPDAAPGILRLAPTARSLIG